MKPILLNLFFVIFIFCVSSCSTNSCPNSVKGEFKDLQGLDGCGMVISLENGDKINPVNLSDFDIEIVDGKKVWVSYSIQENAMGICMVGKIVEIVCVSDR